jgi:hypothetical protein
MRQTKAKKLRRQVAEDTPGMTAEQRRKVYRQTKKTLIDLHLRGQS